MVSIQALSHSFGDHQVLKDINLEVGAAEIVGIMGSSGGGKTTLLRCVSGLITPDSGEVLADGVNVRKDPVAARQRMGMVFQSAALFDYMSVIDNVMFGIRRRLKLDPVASKKAAKEALARVGIVDADLEKLPSELSGGMKKRVGMARALALSPRVMLYDEPTTGLDPITTYSIDVLIAGLRSDHQMTSLLVSHDVNSVVRVVDRIAFLHQGCVIFDGVPAEFLQSKEPSIRELLDRAYATTLNVSVVT